MHLFINSPSFAYADNPVISGLKRALQTPVKGWSIDNTQSDSINLTLSVPDSKFKATINIQPKEEGLFISLPDITLSPNISLFVFNEFLSLLHHFNILHPYYAILLFDDVTFYFQPESYNPSIVMVLKTHMIYEAQNIIDRLRSFIFYKYGSPSTGVLNFSDLKEFAYFKISHSVDRITITLSPTNKYFPHKDKMLSLFAMTLATEIYSEFNHSIQILQTLPL